ncbi:hypothetical protein AB4Z29_05190 [Paenibacillus sp. 2TAB23]|uniref:hypothetical protein n=1 Tax=Paenibacillus sp. 2TAB23 TaxID=3233004 RepID=UPI003F975DA0
MYFNYEAPFEHIPFETMSKREADNFFQWFLGIQQNRIQILIDQFEEGRDGRTIKKLDFTPESLNELWNWFIPRIKQVKKTIEELAEEQEHLPHWLKIDINVNEYKFCKETETTIMDIGLYFSKVFLQMFVQLQWGIVYKPRSFVDVNRPVIVGFNKNMTLNPIRIINNYASAEVNGTSKNNLFDLFNIWRKYVE